ncbi:hypothetical protein [Pectinatus frisingensis]|uniref:hypothetical protein n=1 Tax=Pectinatus frisingensis TaxID=865 RepID=UPI003D8071BB
MKKYVNNDGNSKNYTDIMNEIKSEWPEWKIAVYNDSFAISNHAKKIDTSKC